MASREQQLEKDRQKALGELLVSECRAAEPNLESLETMLYSGADVCFSHAKALYWAAKELKFETVRFLIRHGALAEPIAASYVAKMCDNKGFDEQCEPAFFEILDYCRDKVGGGYMQLFEPYINGMAVSGRMDKLRALMKRYYLTEAEVVGCIYIRIIFEIVLNADDEMLAFINRHAQWMDQSAFDLAVSSGDWLVLEYIIGKVGCMTPGETAVAQAVYAGSFAVLDILLHHGYSFSRNPLYLKKACRAAFTDNCAAVDYLLKHGYTVADTYDGRSILQNAERDGNEALKTYLTRKEAV